MGNVVRVSFLASILLAAVVFARPVEAATLTGVVTDEQQRPVAGAFVTAKNADRKMAVSVVTDAQGRYEIPGLFGGRYVVRAKRIGYQVSEEGNVVLSETPIQRNIRLASTREVGAQLPSNVWLTLLPAGQRKAEFMVYCTICHAMGTAATRGPYSVERWTEILASMRAMLKSYDAILPVDDQSLARWLVSNGFGPDAKPPRLESPAPPTGEATRVVVTEYEVGDANTWAHDMAVEPATGAAWMGDYVNDLLFRVDPRTGDQKRYPLPVKGAGMHTLHFDRGGALWITLQWANMVARFDPKTEAFRLYGGFRKGSLLHSFAYDPFGYVQSDAEGRMWLTEMGGNAIASLDPKTGQVKEYDLPKNQPTASPYGIALDSHGRVWYTKYYENVLGVLDPKTGVVTEREMPRKDSAPHRMTIGALDRLWIPASGYGTLVMYDIAAGTFTEHDLPDADTFPYAVRVDGATGAVWVTGNGSDSFYRFDPATGAFVTYRLPGELSYGRMISLDYASGDVWTTLSSYPNKHGNRASGALVRLQLRRP